jgi:hypothetical protein
MEKQIFQGIDTLVIRVSNILLRNHGTPKNLD